MSGDKPAELPKWEDLQDPNKLAKAQVAGTDFVRSGGMYGPAASLLPGGFQTAFPNGRAYQYGKASNFEEDELNAMLAVVEGTNSSELSQAADVLDKASRAIHAAATALDDDIKAAESGWEGEAGAAFQKWGSELVTTTGKFAVFVKAAGIETQAAGIGLSSVKSSLPGRDGRAVQKRPEAFSEAEKAAKPEEYEAAQKVEKDRQEAINQMNRLASFYSVSAQGLSKLNEAAPTFEMMPDVGMPPPPEGWEEPPVSGGGGGTSAGSSPTIDSSRRLTDDGGVVAPPSRDEGRAPTPPTTPRPDIGTVIDTVQTPPAPSVDRPVGPQPTVPGPGPNQNPITPPFTPGPYQTGPGLQRGGGPPLGGKNLGPNPTKTAPGPQGRPTDTTRPPVGQGRTGDMQGGRPTQTGPGGGRQNTGNPANGRNGGTGGRQDQMGRAIQGGTQRPTSTPGTRSDKSPGTREGITGGRQTPTGRNVTGRSSQGTNRGNVIGNQDPAANRSTTGRVSQRGVVGAPQASASTSRPSGTGRTVQGASGAVSGQPTARNSAGRTAQQGFSAGGSGLVRPGQRQDRDEEEPEGTERPEWLVEDPETHLPDRPRPNVPPVIN